MPYVSKAQEAYFNANKDKLEAKGVNVSEWNEASKGMRLPERKGEGKDAHHSEYRQVYAERKQGKDSKYRQAYQLRRKENGST